MDILNHINLCKQVLSEIETIESKPCDIEIKVNLFENAEGSSIVHMSNTIVTCGLKIKVLSKQGMSHNLELKKGMIVTNLEIPPICSSNIVPGPQSEEAQALCEQLDMFLLNHGPDLDKLVIEEDKAVYVLYFDFIVINHCGNLLDAFILAANAVIASTKFPRMQWISDKDCVIQDPTTAHMPIPYKNRVFCVSSGIVKDRLLTQSYDSFDDCTIVTVFVNESGLVMIPTITGMILPSQRGLIREASQFAVERVSVLKNILLKACK